MRPLSRQPVNKKAGAARAFRNATQRTQSKNMRQAPLRGGWRL